LSEFLRLRRPLAPAVALVLLGAILVLFSVVQAAAHRQWARASEALELLGSDPGAYCADFGFDPSTAECEAFLRVEAEVQREYRRDTIHRFPVVSAQHDPVGVGGVAAGLLTTAPGALAMLAVSAGYTAGEWTRRTMGWLIARDPRRIRLVLLRFSMTWLVGVALIVAVWLALIAMIPLFRWIYDLPPAPAGIDFSDFAIEQAIRAVPVLGVYAAIGTAAAFLTRTPLAAFLTGVFFLALGVAVSSVVPWHRFSVGYLVGGWMRFSPDNLLVDHLWVDTFPGRMAGDVSLALGLAGTTAVALAVASLVARRSAVPV
jgi:hypothetical protein